MRRRALVIAALMAAGCAQVGKQDEAVRKALEGKIAVLEDQVDEQIAAMKQYRAEKRLDEIMGALTGERVRLAGLEEDLVVANNAADMATANVDQVKAWVMGKLPDSIDIQAEEERDGQVIAMESMRLNLLIDRDVLTHRFDGPPVADIDDKIAAMDRAIATRRAAVASDTANRMLTAAQSSAARAQERLAEQVRERDAEKEKIDGMEKVMAEYRAMERQYDGMVRRLDELKNERSVR